MSFDWRYIVGIVVLAIAARDLFNAYQRKQDEEEEETKGGESP